MNMETVEIVGAIDSILTVAVIKVTKATVQNEQLFRHQG